MGFRYSICFGWAASKVLFSGIWSQGYDLPCDRILSGKMIEYVSDISTIRVMLKAIFFSGPKEGGVQMNPTIFVNFSNHPSNLWSEKQKSAALSNTNEIADIPFPEVDPEIDPDEIAQLGDRYVDQILALPAAAVMCQGEFTLSYYVVSQLKKRGIVCLAACNRRNVREKILEDGRIRKEAEFEFVRFREYRG